MLASCLKTSFTEVLQSSGIQPTKPDDRLARSAGTSPNGGPPAGAKEGEKDAPEVSGTLTGLQRRLANSELNHHVNLKKGDYEEFKAALEEKWTKREVPKLVESILKRYGGKKPVPKKKVDKIEAAFNLLLELD